MNSQGQQDVVDAVGQALDDVAARLVDLDSSNRSRHERMAAAVEGLHAQQGQAVPVDLEAMTGGLERIETFLEALVDAADDNSDTEKTVAAMTRIEGRMAEMTRQREEQSEATKKVLNDLGATVSRLASAQAEDRERIVARIEDELRTFSNQPKPAIDPASIDGSALEQMAVLGNQIEALRRRMALRARPEAPALDGGALDAIAEAVVARLTPSAGRSAKASPAKSTAKQAPTTERKATRPRAPRSQA